MIERKKEQKNYLQNLRKIIVNILIMVGLIFALKYFIVRDFNKLQKILPSKFSASFLVVDQSKVAIKAKIKTLNRQMPSFAYLLEVYRNDEDFNESQFDKYINYYQKVTEYMPHLPDAWGILGFSYHYYPQRVDQAIEAYEKAIALNPNFFWFYHNIGILYYQNGDYDKAIIAFEKAINQDLQNSINFIVSSKYVYRPLIMNLSANVNILMKTQLEAGYKNCIKLLILSNDELKNYNRVLEISSRAAKMGIKDKEFLYFYLGKSSFYLKKYKESIIFLQKCIKENPKNAEALKYLSLSLNSIGEQEASVAILKSMIMLHKTKQAEKVTLEDIKLQIY